jgi:hypothetical protein
MKLKDPTPSPMPAGGSPLRDQQPVPYYLIERTDLGQPHWLAAIGFDSMWITKAIKADRFVSRAEAETHASKVRDLMPLFAQHIIVTEHLDV